jgi:hypothetical protein
VNIAEGAGRIGNADAARSYSADQFVGVGVGVDGDGDGNMAGCFDGNRNLNLDPTLDECRQNIFVSIAASSSRIPR